MCYLPMAAQRARSFNRRVFMAGKQDTLIRDDLGHSPLYTPKREKPVTATSPW